LQLALAAWWLAMLAVLSGGYTFAIFSILGNQGQGVVAIGIGFAAARLIAREVGRRYPRQARNFSHRRRARWTYWGFALGGFIVFGALWLAAPSNHELSLALIITGAGFGLILNSFALAAAFRAGISDFAVSRHAA
jgi:hypothetical protein